MSGRKASEVEDSLRDNKKIRNTSINVMNNIFYRAKEAIEQTEQREQTVLSELNQTKFSIEKEVYTELPELAAELEKEFYHLKNTYTNYKKKYHITEINNEYQRIIKEYQKADSEADKISRDIEKKIQSQRRYDSRLCRYDAWWCDDEFKRAEIVKQKYNHLAQSVNQLKRKCEEQYTLANTANVTANEKLQQFHNLQKRIKEIEEKAKAIQKMKQEATESRKAIQSDFEKIQEKIALKFLKKDYENLHNEMEQALRMTDENIIQNYNTLTSKIETFHTQLDKIYAQFIEKQNTVKMKIKCLQERLQNKVYSNPEDEFKNIEEMEKHTLSEFLAQYAKGKYVAQIEEFLEKIENLFEKEEFEKAEQEMEKANSLCDEASEEAARIHENRMKTIYNMLSIREAMADLDYDVRVTKNKEWDDGYSIECSIGDEKITFDRVTVEEDGTPVIDIFHEEATKGTCANTWLTIREQLAAEGIYVKDITKNGTSIYKNDRIVDPDTNLKHIVGNR